MAFMNHDYAHTRTVLPLSKHKLSCMSHSSLMDISAQFWITKFKDQLFELVLGICGKF